jgi:hypothetical protein
VPSETDAIVVAILFKLVDQIRGRD